ncbi:MAG: phage tail protein [Saccharofermentanales bacterium]
MGTDNFGLKIGIEGEKEFKNALRDINSSFKVLGSEMNLVSSQFDKQDRSIDAITARNRVLNREIDTQSQKVRTLESALKNASESFGETDKRTIQWHVQLNNAKAGLNSLERELKQNDAALESVGKELNDAEQQSEQFNKALKQTSATADHADNKFSKLGSTLGKIGLSLGVGIAAIGAAAISAGKALTDMTVGASAYADEILTQSTITGMSTESLQVYKYAAELVDVSMETLTGSMSKQIKSMSNARDGSEKFADAYKKLGVSVADSSGTLRDSETVYWETIDALGKVSNETERDALAMQIFGKSARELNPLIAQGSKGIAELTEEAGRMGAVMSGDSLNALGKFDDSVQRLKSGFGAAKNALGTILLPQLQFLADDGVSLLGQFTTGLNAAGGDFGKISQVIGDTIGGIADMILKSLPKIMAVAVDIVMALINSITENLPMLIELATTVVFKLLEGLITALPAIAEGAVQLVLALADGILENLPMLLQAAIDMVISLALGLAKALPELIPAIVRAVILIAETLIENIDLLLDAALQIVMALAEGIIVSLPILIEKIPELMDKLIVALTDNMPRLIEMGVLLTVQLAAGLIKAVPSLLKNIPGIISSIAKGFVSGAGNLLDVGKNLVQGLWDGIKNMKDWILDKISGFGVDILKGIKSVFGIHSPSKLMETEVGENLGLGIAAGISNTKKSIGDALSSAIPRKIDTLYDFNVSGEGVRGAKDQNVIGTADNSIALKIENFYNNRAGDIKQLLEEVEFYRRQIATARGG